MARSPHLSVTVRDGHLDLMLTDAPEGHWSNRHGVVLPLSDAGPLTAEHIKHLRSIADHAERMISLAESVRRVMDRHGVALKDR